MNSIGSLSIDRTPTLQRRQGAPGIAVADLGEEIERVVGGVDLLRAEAALLVGEGAPQQRLDLLVRQRLEREDLAAAQERRVDREERVLRRRPDQDDAAFLDVRQQHVLLGAIEAVQLIDEQDGAPAAVGQLGTRASSSSSRTSLMPTATALTWRKTHCVWLAMTWARAVLPQPGGP